MRKVTNGVMCNPDCIQNVLLKSCFSQEVGSAEAVEVVWMNSSIFEALFNKWSCFLSP